MSIRAYCRIPEKASSTLRAKEGGCPALLYDLFAELEGATEIHIAAYLFNNPSYFDFLSKLAQKGCRIRITSLPPLGYNDKPIAVEGYDKKVSARQVATEIYDELSSSTNMELEIFPHLYVWYGALYAGGGASYSFHVKAIYAKFPSSQNRCILSSGNFMLTDPSHSDNILVIGELPDYEKAFTRFFGDLEKYSIPYDEFCSRFTSYRDEFQYSLIDKEIDLPSDEFRNCFFTAPFYFYSGIGSNHYAGNRIIDLIRKAERRVWVCAQHFHDLVSFDPGRETIIGELYRKYLIDPTLEFRFLKQVPHSSLADKRRAGIAETLFQFVMKAKQRYNRLTHDKFMIIDKTLLVSTANYTPTQFAFGQRRMEMKDQGTRILKVDYFSEVNGFVVIPDCPDEVLRHYENHFDALWEDGQDIEINI